MIQTKKIALLVDVDNVKIGGEAFNELYSKLNEIGDVVYCKFYGYNDRKHIYLSDAITKYGYDTAPFMRNKRRISQLDNRIIVDALKLNYTKTEIDTYCIVAGNGDLIPMLVELKTSGRTLIDVNTPYQEQNYHMFDAHLNLETLSLEAETYKPKTRKGPKKAKAEKPTPTPKVEAKEDVPTTTTKETNFSIDEVVREQTPQMEVPTFEPAPQSQNEQLETVSDDDRLSEMLRDITNRYAELNFETNDDMAKKLQLIKDIERFIQTETNKGEGLNSASADVRQIFVELSNIVEDMKGAI